MSTANTGIARLAGSAVGVVHEGDSIVTWFGQADLYVLDPPLRGYTVVVASTLPNAPRVSARGGQERGVETFLLGVTGEDMQCDPYQEELPGSGWGNTASEALAEAGYQLV
ncbi:Uncharacterised protein [Mycolicibacterium fortuitum]|uniref:Uncharacterized protein n=1 Tax=Mycolicibacterium fortuitum TaxID=1766 RepID=A0A378WFJ6_MYCFO|nr:Uncharacterised protein [Mycolicibacterium fortuitum]